MQDISLLTANAPILEIEHHLDLSQNLCLNLIIFLINYMIAFFEFFFSKAFNKDIESFFS